MNLEGYIPCLSDLLHLTEENTLYYFGYFLKYRSFWPIIGVLQDPIKYKGKTGFIGSLRCMQGSVNKINRNVEETKKSYNNIYNNTTPYLLLLSMAFFSRL